MQGRRPKHTQHTMRWKTACIARGARPCRALKIQWLALLETSTGIQGRKNLHGHVCKVGVQSHRIHHTTSGKDDLLSTCRYSAFLHTGIGSGSRNLHEWSAQTERVAIAQTRCEPSSSSDESFRQPGTSVDGFMSSSSSLRPAFRYRYKNFPCRFSDQSEWCR